MILSTLDQALDLVPTLMEQPLIGIDTETEGCDPRKRSPLYGAELLCVTLAWGPPSEVTPNPKLQGVYVPGRLAPYLAEVYKECQFVGTNWWGFDNHVFRVNGLPEIRCHDTLVLSRLLDPNPGGHSLKAWGARLGYEVEEFGDVRSRPVRLKPKVYKTSNSTREAGEMAVLSQKRREMIPFAEFERDYKHRMDRWVEYAIKDAKMSLDVYRYMRDRL